MGDKYQDYIFSWPSKIWAPIFVRPKAVTDLKKGLYSPLETLEMIEAWPDTFIEI